MNKNSSVPGPRYEALLQMLRTSEALWNASRIFFEQWELSASQFNILNVLRDKPEGVTQIELSRMLIMHRSNVTGLVDRLEGRGLVARHETPGDRRVYHVALTPAGSELLEEILPDYYRLAEKVWGDFPLFEANRIATVLKRIEANVEELSRTVTSPAQTARV
ncbi:MAG: MarR family transcriptional regulator [Opitutales bacterium]